jgi:hypothetical protein
MVGLIFFPPINKAADDSALPLGSVENSEGANVLAACCALQNSCQRKKKKKKKKKKKQVFGQVAVTFGDGRGPFFLFFFF